MAPGAIQAEGTDEVEQRQPAPPVLPPLEPINQATTSSEARSSPLETPVDSPLQEDTPHIPLADSIALGMDDVPAAANEDDKIPIVSNGSANGNDSTTPENASNGNSNGNASGGVHPAAANGTNGTAAAKDTNGTATTSPLPADLPPTTELGPKQDPIAIIGMSCRLPGGASDPEAFYQLCCLGRSGWTPMPPDRFSKDGYHHPDPDRLGCYNPAGGCFLAEDVALFDAPFFKITEREALAMDPQHRLILECAYEALENAGLPMASLAGKNVGVYAGGSFTDYELNNLRDLDTAPMHQSTGNAPSLLANRVSYFFDFRGPSYTVDTACSSSLTALHLAVQSLRSGDASVVVLASSHLNLLPDHFVSMSSQGLLSPDGRSYAFDSRANGFGRGEGAGVVILKPLSAALRDNDPVRAVVVGTGLNQDGRTNGITMPNKEAQLDLMRKVYADNGLDPRETGYVEAHGTGTRVGDPLEMEALHRMFHDGRTSRRPLWVGSVKTNVGHLEGASGIVSMIKSAMMLERGYLLPNHDFRDGNREIPFDEWGVRVPSRVMPWPRGMKYASINSFGFGGGNAHAVLAAPPRQAKPVAAAGGAAAAFTPGGYVEPKRVFVVSAHSKAALAEQMRSVTVYLERRPVAFQGSLLSDMAYTLGQRRSFLPYKFFAVGSEGNGLISTFVHDAPSSPVRSTRPPRLGFVFTGQGAQWHAMGRELIAAYPVFKGSLERFDACLARLGARFSLLEELTDRDAKTSRISEAELSQPGCTAVQLALVDLLRAWGVRPDAVVGHSSGEIGAAYAAGALTHDECAAVAYLRGQSVLQLKAAYPDLRGGMLAVGAGPDEVRRLIKTLKQDDDEGHRRRVTVACVNSPGSVTASGDAAAVEELQAKAEEAQLFNRRVRVETAYHSHHMELVAGWYGASVGELYPMAGNDNDDDGHEVEFYSSLRGDKLVSLAELDTSYWVQNLTQPVLFSQAVTRMCTPEPGRDKMDVLVEIGPHAALEGPVKQILKAVESLPKKPQYLASLVRNKDAVDTALNLAGSLFVHGAAVDFGAVNFPVPPPKAAKVLSDMPKYAWDHKTRYWWETRLSRAHLHRRFPRNDVLGSMADWSNDVEPTWRSILRADDVPWVRGHAMQGMTVFPMACYLSMAIEAAAQRAAVAAGLGAAQEAEEGGLVGKFIFRDVTISRPLIVQEGVDSETNITLRPNPEGTRESSAVWDEFRIFSWNKEREWIEHCRGLIRVEHNKPGAVTSAAAASSQTNTVHDASADAAALLEARRRRVLDACTEAVRADRLYGELEAVTARYGAQFRSMENCAGGDTACVADVVMPDTAKVMPKGHEAPLHIHPALLDQFTHAAWVILGAGRGKLPALYMPRFFKGLTVSADVRRLAGRPGDRIRVYGEGNPNFANPGSTKISMFATTMDGQQELISMEGLVIDPIFDGDAAVAEAVGARELCFKESWEPLYPEIAGSSPSSELQVSNGVNGTNGTNGVHEEATDIATAPRPRATREITDSVMIVATQQQQDAEGLATALKSKLLASHTSDRAPPDIHLSSLEAAPADPTADSPYAAKVCVVLVELDGEPLLAGLDAGAFARVQRLILSAKGILWVVRGAHSDATDPRLGMILGLARTVRSETGMKFATLDLDGEGEGAPSLSSSSSAVARDAGFVAEVASHVFGKPTTPDNENDDAAASTGGDPDMEFQERRGLLSVCRVADDVDLDAFVEQHTNPATPPFAQPFGQPGRPLRLAVGTKGALDTLHFVDDDKACLPLGPDEIQIEIKVTSMNFKDIMVSMGEVPSPYLGVECAGLVSAVGSSVGDFKVGDRVCASSEGAYSTYTRCRSTSAARVPDDMTLEAAATVPVVFSTAYYGLFDVGRLRRGESVLIHAAAGGVGQAAVMLARMIGAEVYATVGSAAKKDFLTSTYGVPEDHIFYSRDVSFAEAVRRATGGRGVDVVLNSLAGDALRETWECLACFGRFVEIGKRSILANASLGMAVFDKNASFSSIDLTLVASEKPRTMRRLLDDVFKLLSYGAIRPISPTTAFSISEVEAAFRTLQAGKVHGKILVTAAPDDMVKATYSTKAFEKLLRPDATYIVVGGTGGIGRSIARWMTQKGARHITLVSRSAKVAPKVAQLIDEARSEHGARIVVSQCDVSLAADVEKMIAELAAAQMPAVKGVIHSAMILDDVLFEKMEFPQWESVVRSKVAGGWNLHKALLGRPLDFFIALSSVAGIIGNQGQSAYAAANTFLDSLTRHRRRLGLPAASLDLAAVSDTGYLAENAERQREVLAQIGGEAISEREILALVAAAVSGVADATCGGQVVTGLRLSPAAASLPFWASDARFSPLRAALQERRAAEGGGGGGVGAAASAISPGAALRRAGSYEDAHRIVIDALLDKTAGVLMLPREELDPSKGTVFYGLDSLVSIEIRNWITREFGSVLQILDLLSSGSFSSLADTVLKKTELCSFDKVAALNLS
ncbi:hypothetical protein RB598_007393 [Gaeumannomyces tritici]